MGGNAHLPVGWMMGGSFSGMGLTLCDLSLLFCVLPLLNQVLPRRQLKLMVSADLATLVSHQKQLLSRMCHVEASACV